MSDVKSRTEAEQVVYDIIAKKAFQKLGWDYENEVLSKDASDDARLINAVGPTFVDVTLDEVLSVLSAETEAVMGKEVPEQGYTYAVQNKILRGKGKWEVVPYDGRETNVDAALATWRADERFTAKKSGATLYVRAK